MSAREKALAEAERIAADLREQDNRITSHPVFVVEQKRRIYGVDSDYTDSFVWVNPNDFEAVSETRKKGWRKLGYIEVWEFVTACLTEKGCEVYLRVNAHNLSSPRIYVYSGWRNHEWQTLRSMMPALAAFTHTEPEASDGE